MNDIICEKCGKDKECHQIMHEAINAELIAALKEAQLQIIYLHEKFQPTGTGNATLEKIVAVIAKVEAQ